MRICSPTKGGVWQWGNEKVLRESLEIEAYFYILHRDGTPFANVMNIGCLVGSSGESVGERRRLGRRT